MTFKKKKLKIGLFHNIPIYIPNNIGIEYMQNNAKKNKSIVACLIEQGTLEKNNKKISKKDYYILDKEFFFKTLLENLDNKSKIISIMKNGQLYFNLLDDQSPHLFLPTECSDIIKKKLQT